MTARQLLFLGDVSSGSLHFFLRAGSCQLEKKDSFILTAK